MRELSSASSRNHLFTCCRPHCVQFRPSSSRTTRPGVQHTTKAPGEKEKQATGTQTSGSLFRFLLAQPSISGIKTLRVFFDYYKANVHLSSECFKIWAFYTQTTEKPLTISHILFHLICLLRSCIRGLHLPPA